MEAQPHNRIAGAGAFLRRALALAALWWVLDEGRTDGWWFGGLVIAGALAARPLFPLADNNWRWSPSGLLRFIPYFLKLSARGGWDVARRAFSRRAALDPSLFIFTTRLENPTARIFLAHVISLLPGTLTADLRGDTLQIHALFGSPDELRTETERLEARVGDLFGQHRAPGAPAP